MLDNLFQGVFDVQNAGVGVTEFLLCIATALLCGAILAFCYARAGHCTRSFLATLFMLPAVVCVVIMMVNGNVGAGVAVAGAFSLVRFRSVPGSAREITVVFLAMGAGLILGMGYLAYGILFSLLMALVGLIWSRLEQKVPQKHALEKLLRISIPEDLDYSQVFTDILNAYTSRYTLTRVKTTNMGSVFRLTYEITLKDPGMEKALIDDLRCRNGNLEISLSRPDTTVTEL